MVEIPVALIVSILVAWTGMFIGITKWLLSRFLDQIEKRFTKVDERDDARKLEQDTAIREIWELRNEVSRDFVRREDWIRFSVTIDAKLDRVHEQLAKALKGPKHGSGKSTA